MCPLLGLWTQTTCHCRYRSTISKAASLKPRRSNEWHGRLRRTTPESGGPVYLTLCHRFQMYRLITGPELIAFTNCRVLYTSLTNWLCWLILVCVPSSRVVLDSWVVSQIWLDSDSNESSQSRVGRENEGYVWVESESNHADRHLSQSWGQLDTAWVKVEALIFLKRNVNILHLSVVGKEPTYVQLHSAAPPSPQSTTFGQNR